MTKETATTGAGWVLYDGECPWCAGLARRLAVALGHRGFALAPLQTPWVRARLGLAEGARPEEMAVLTAQGRALGGADAVLELARLFWWARWLRGLARLPGGMRLLRAGYGWVASHRPCAGGACRLPARPAGREWRVGALALLPPVLALGATWRAEGWIAMWSVAFALFASVKWLSWRAAGARVGQASCLPRRAERGAMAERAPGETDARPESGVMTRNLRAAGFLLAWPGMDAVAFCDPGRRAIRATGAEWRWAAVTTLVGGGLVWGLSRHVVDLSPLAAGWTGMVGLVLGLHFGLFHLISLAWRRAGVDAAPIMDAPLRATSLAEFWGQRWNRGFSVPARRLLLQPLAGRIGRVTAMLVVFLVSGLLHELVISFPARAGFGLPLAYFALQGAAMQVERSHAGRRLGLGQGGRGWLFTMLCVAGPAFWLFHPPFVHRVILPFLQTLGAL